jgi:hypothetical protein
MEQQVCKHIKRFYRIAKRTRFFECEFYELISSFIKRNILARRVNWVKFEYEFKTIARKCTQKSRSAKCYLRAVISLVIICLQGNYKSIPSFKIIQRVYR